MFAASSLSRTRPSKSSIRVILSSMLWLREASLASSRNRWLTQTRLWEMHHAQVAGLPGLNEHLILRRLHSQQLRVPLRTFRSSGDGMAESAF